MCDFIFQLLSMINLKIIVCIIIIRVFLNKGHKLTSYYFICVLIAFLTIMNINNLRYTLFSENNLHIFLRTKAL